MSVQLYNHNSSGSVPDMKSPTTFLIVCVVAIVQSTWADDTQDDLVRAYFPSEEIARKAAISYHHALFASPYDQGFLVMQLNQKEKKELATFGFVYEQAPNYQRRLEQVVDQIQTAAKLSSAKATIAGFPCYDTVESTYEIADGLASSYPTLANWIDIGDSWAKSVGQGGYDLRVLRLSNQNIQKTKPILFVHSAMHAREYATAPLTLAFATQLLEGYDRNADMTWILDHHEIHLMFHMNPDGRKQAEQGELWRKNINSSYCSADSASVGVDLNRNFTFFWNTTVDGSSGDECDATFRGPGPASEPETQAVEAYVRSIFADRRGPGETDAAPLDTSGMHIDIHSFSELVLWPWGHLSTPPPNGNQLQTLGRKLAFFNGYAPIQSVGLYPTDGTSDDVSYGELGVAAITFEIGTEFFESCSVFESPVKPDNLLALTYAARVVSAPYQLPSGPDVYELKINDNGNNEIFVTGDFSLSATASDTRTNNSQGTEPSQPLKAVEYYLDVYPLDAGAQGFIMAATDGGFDSETEAVQTTVSTTGLSNDRHILYVRAQDQSDTWGPISAIFVNLGSEPTNQAPTANFAYSCNGTTCDFDGTSSSDPDGSIVMFQWDFGDGSNAEQGERVSHSYAASGTFSVSLNVTDDDSATSDMTMSVIALTPPAPAAPATGGGGACGLFFLILLFRRRLGFLSINNRHAPRVISITADPICQKIQCCHLIIRKNNLISP